jgi:small-conductance mechanosensitive channel
VRRDSGQLRQFLETRGRTWREAGLARELSRRAVRRARIELAVLLPILAALLAIYSERERLLGPEWDTAVRMFTALGLAALGWKFARDVGRALGPALLRKLDTGTAGTVGFLIRLITVVVMVTVALRIAGLTPHELALGGAVTAVVVGLAAQQTFGNVIAGTVLLSARPFRVGERVRLQGGGLAGSVEGAVSSLGLLYTTLASREGPLMVPNAIVLSVAVVPLTEPSDVTLRARLRPGVTPADVERLLQERITTPLRGKPRITLEELDADSVVVSLAATPQRPTDGPRLASEVLSIVGSQTGRGDGDGVRDDGPRRRIATAVR